MIAFYDKIRFNFIFIFLLVTAIVNTSLATSPQSILLAKNGSSCISVYIPVNASSTQAFAASELAHYLNNISGASFDIVNSKIKNKSEIILTIDLKLPVEDYSISIQNRNIVLAAGSDRAILFAVYNFLQQLGCCWLAPQFSFYKGHSEYIPALKILYYNYKQSLLRHPQFAIRKIDVEEGRTHTIENLQQLIEWMPKVGLNTLMVPLNYQGAGKVQWDKWRQALIPALKKRDLLIEVGGHGYQNFLNANMEDSALFSKHPQWFGKNKKGQPDAALNIVFNTSNNDAVYYFISNISNYVIQHPEIDIFDIWPPDVARWAECPEMAALGTPADRQATLINKVDSALHKIRPAIRLEIIAYGQVLQPPKNVRLNPDILVDVCPIDQSFEKPIYDTSHQNNKEYTDAIYNWRKIFSGDLGLYSYYRKYAWRSLPVILPHFIQNELQWYRQMHFNSISCYSEPGDWYTYELNHYTLAALAWNTSLSVDSLIHHYCLLRYPENTSLALNTYKTLENIVPHHCSLPFTTRKSKAEYFTARENLQLIQHQLEFAIQRADIPVNMKRLLLMLKYAALDISLVENSTDQANKESTVQSLADFLNENSGDGVFLNYSFKTLLKPYTSQ